MLRTRDIVNVVHLGIILSAWSGSNSSREPWWYPVCFWIGFVAAISFVVLDFVQYQLGLRRGGERPFTRIIRWR